MLKIAQSISKSITCTAYETFYFFRSWIFSLYKSNVGIFSFINLGFCFCKMEASLNHFQLRYYTFSKTILNVYFVVHETTFTMYSYLGLGSRAGKTGGGEWHVVLFNICPFKKISIPSLSGKTIGGKV